MNCLVFNPFVRLLLLMLILVAGCSEDDNGAYQFSADESNFLSKVSPALYHKLHQSGTIEIALREEGPSMFELPGDSVNKIFFRIYVPPKLFEEIVGENEWSSVEEFRTDIQSVIDLSLDSLEQSRPFANRVFNRMFHGLIFIDRTESCIYVEATENG